MARHSRGRWRARPWKDKPALLSAGLALFDAWAGLTLAYYTDWPTSFWISALSAALHLLAVAYRRVQKFR